MQVVRMLGDGKTYTHFLSLFYVMSSGKRNLWCHWRKGRCPRRGKGRQQDDSTQEITYRSCDSVRMREQILGQLAKLKGKKDKKKHVTSYHRYLDLPRESASHPALLISTIKFRAYHKLPKHCIHIKHQSYLCDKELLWTFFDSKHTWARSDSSSPPMTRDQSN
jgi:hypothetical protein